MEFQLTALSAIWTGDAEGKEDLLVATGILGSLRWWFEVLVRGLGGGACDPTSTECEGGVKGSRCVVCELFGCTGWSRKFRFGVIGADGLPLASKIVKDQKFALRCTPLRDVGGEEWQLLGLALKLISSYSALGAKTVYKPSDEADRRDKPRHRDYGLVRLDTAAAAGDRQALEGYVRGRRSVDARDFAWASLANFWFVADRHLARIDSSRSTFNRVIGRPEEKPRAQGGDSWIAGSRGVSKKVFSFKAPARTYGFVDPPRLTFDAMKGKLKQAWPDLKENQFLSGEQVLARLLQS